MDDEKVYFKPGDTVILKQGIANRPKMVVVCKVSSYLRNPKTNYFKGIKCRWFSKNQELQEAIFNTKDLVLLEVAEDSSKEFLDFSSV